MLPPEIITLIANHLSCNNKFACLFVCREWYHVFLPTLYKSLLLKKRERNGPYDTIQKRKLGEVVRELSLDDGILIGNILENLGNMCPSITTLHFRWHCSPEEESHHNNLRRLVRRRINPNDYSCVPILSSIRASQLQHLTLCCFRNNNYRIGTSTIETPDTYALFNEILPLIPCQLSTLTLNGILHMLRAADLDRIHAHCVRLSTLKLVGCNLLLAGDNSRVGDEALTYPTMKSISLAYPAGWTKLMDWLSSLSRRYPNLSMLSLQNTAPGSAIMRNIDIEPLQQSFSDFANQHYQHLEQVRLVYLDLPTFDIYQSFLMPLSNLRDLTLHDRRCLDLGQLVDTFERNKSVARLDTQLCPKPSSDPTFLQRLRLHLPSLRTLKTLHIDMMDKNINLRNLLDHCNSIKSLTITRAKIGFPKLYSQWTTTTLEQLRLKCSHFSAEGIQRFLPCCPKLRIFYARNCHIHQGMHIKVQFDFSSIHTLESICLMNLTFRDQQRDGQECGHLATVFTLSPFTAHCNIEDDSPVRKKRRCDKTLLSLSSPVENRQRWFYIGHSLDTFCTHFDSDPNESPSRNIRKSRIQELDPKSMKDAIINGWNPYTLRKYPIRPPTPPSYISILYYSHIKDLLLNGHKIVC
ncbi:hypothetical protein BDA99DRAFT_494562 [Phascolomyces articulosus]|uniref:F-box domain-containing protein n=1 Tax=Phascolomyces articulosus TaxID=60185 RepID=A0AAD5KPL1_9FUNG|nr:hypothetical protein BDA99DRAFT_494562 [Phascolomyces articulosus]